MLSSLLSLLRGRISATVKAGLGKLDPNDALVYDYCNCLMSIAALLAFSPVWDLEMSSARRFSDGTYTDHPREREKLLNTSCTNAK
jgi:hypothetical protein